MAGKPETTEHGGPIGWPQLSLYLSVIDAAESLTFYANAFGFTPSGEAMTDDAGVIQHAAMVRDEVAIMFAPEGSGKPMSSPKTNKNRDSHSFYIYVPDIDAFTHFAEAAGATVLAPPADQFWGDRMAVFRCPNGYHWTFATHVAEFDPSKMA